MVLYSTYWSRWCSLSAVIFVYCFVGIGTAYGLFSNTLKEHLGYSQSDIDLIASFGTLGTCSSFLVGLLLEVFSPARVFQLGALCSLVGLLYISLATNDAFESSAYKVSAAFYIASFGVAAFGIAGQSTCLRNFPSADRGKICGILKSILGISSGLLAIIFENFFEDTKVVPFLLTIGLLLLGVGTAASIPLNVIPSSNLCYTPEISQNVDPTFSHYLWWYGGLVSIVTMGIILQEWNIEVIRPYWGIGVMIYISGILIIPFCYGKIIIETVDIQDYSLLEKSIPHEGRCKITDEHSNAKPISIPCEHNADMTFQGALADFRFWSLLFAFMCGTGSGFVVISNVATISNALGQELNSALVSVVSLFISLGQLSGGWISDKIVLLGYPRSAMLCSYLVLSTCVNVLFSFGNPHLLFFGVALAGVSFGSIYSIMLAVCGDCFGTRHIATIFGLLNLGPAIGSFLFVSLLFNFVYGTNDDCLGKECFSNTFRILALFTLFSAVLIYISLVRSSGKASESRVKLVSALHIQ